jgi:hypothetical protein
VPIVLSVLLLCLAGNCSSASIVPARPVATPTERVVLPADFGGVVSVRLGDVLIVRPPMTADEWQVRFDDKFLEYQGTPESRRRPAAEGWKFNAIAAGDTSLTVTPIVRRGPNPPRFTVTFHVE